MEINVKFELQEYGYMPETNETEIRYILMDALGEFVSHRGPTARQYVAKRYNDNSFSEEWKERKIVEVDHRRSVSEALKNSVSEIKITK